MPGVRLGGNAPALHTDRGTHCALASSATGGAWVRDPPDRRKAQFGRFLGRIKTLPYKGVCVVREIYRTRAEMDSAPTVAFVGGHFLLRCPPLLAEFLPEGAGQGGGGAGGLGVTAGATGEVGCGVK